MRTVIFRPTNKCNLRCTYCYDKNNHRCGIESIRKSATELFKREEESLLESFDKLYEGEDNPKIIFHGGEPLIIDSKVLDGFLEELTKNRNLGVSIQTNGTLIDEGVIDLFKKYNFGVGLSLDGCDEIQNSSRIYPNGKNSFSRVFNRIKLLQDQAIKFGIIMSINKSHQGCEQKLYNFISDNNISCNIRPVFASDEATAKQVMTPDEYTTFFNNLFDIWFNDKDQKVKTRQITELYIMLRQVLENEYKDRTCNNSNSCFNDFISLDVYSNLYACNRLYGIDEFYYGNLKDISMEEVQRKIDKLLEIRNASIKESCKECDRLSKCNGGCPAESYDIYGDIKHRTPQCETNEKILRYIRGKTTC